MIPEKQNKQKQKKLEKTKLYDDFKFASKIKTNLRYQDILDIYEEEED